MPGPIAKPQMRRLLEAQIKKMLIGGTIASIVGGLGWKYLHTEPLRKSMQEYWANYDAEKHLSELHASGLMQSYNFLKEKEGGK